MNNADVMPVNRGPPLSHNSIMVRMPCRAAAEYRRQRRTRPRAISPPSWRHDHPGQPARPRPRRPPRHGRPRHRPRHRVSQDHPRAAHPRQPAPQPLAGSPSNPRLHSGPRDGLISSTGPAGQLSQASRRSQRQPFATGRFQGTLPAHPGRKVYLTVSRPGPGIAGARASPAGSARASIQLLRAPTTSPMSCVPSFHWIASPP